MNRVQLAFVSFALLTIAASGCAHYPTYGANPTPSYNPSSPTPSPTASSTCQAESTAATQFIAISPSIAATADPTYGQLFGYGLYNLASQTVPSQSSVVLLLPTDVVQFVNFDTLNNYSAVGFSGATFPPLPYTFPSGAVDASGSLLGASGWSTGLLQPNLCFSQTFTMPAVSGSQTKAVLFGDFDHYNSDVESIRGVVVVSNSAPQSRRHHLAKKSTRIELRTR